MEAFFFKQQSIEDKMRDENGILYKDPDTGKTENEDYISIQLKIPRKDCTIDFQNMARWAAVKIFEKHSIDLPISAGYPEVPQQQLKNAMVSYLEGCIADLKDNPDQEPIQTSASPEGVSGLNGDG